MLKLKHALLASLCLLPLPAAEAMAATAGVTAAVNQNAKSIPPGGAIRTVVLGANVVQDETIETDGGGLVQILLADGTTFTVGPNSSITIDRFVYDPAANTAQVTASLGRGVFRFIGGRTSKTEGGVQLNTPVGTVGIRGGMADLNFTGNGGTIAQIDLLFGNEVTLGGDGGQRLFQAGYSIIIGANGAPSVVKTPPGSANFIQQALAGRPGQSGGSSEKPDDGKVASSGVPGSNSGSTPPPQQIPQPDLRAIDLATPKPNDNHQVAENVGQQLPTPGKRGFSAGSFYFQGEDGLGAPANDLKADTYIRFDSNGKPIGGVVVIGMEAAEDYEGTIHAVKLAARVGDYPGAGRVTLSYNDDEYGTITGLTTSITDSSDLDSVEWSGSENMVNCECISWGTWEATFDTLAGFEDAGLKGTWITGDFATASQYDGYANYNYGSASYEGTAVGYGQYMIDGVTSAMFAATGQVEVDWYFGSESGTFSLINFGGDVNSPSQILQHSFNSDAAIDRGMMEKGLFSGATDPLATTSQHLSVTGAFIDNGTSAGGVMGSFSGLEVFEDENDDLVVFTGSGVYVAGPGSL